MDARGAFQNKNKTEKANGFQSVFLSQTPKFKNSRTFLFGFERAVDLGIGLQDKV